MLILCPVAHCCKWFCVLFLSLNEVGLFLLFLQMWLSLIRASAFISYKLLVTNFICCYSFAYKQHWGFFYTNTITYDATCQAVLYKEMYLREGQTGQAK